MAFANKIDSNFTGLRFAEEVTDKIGVLPGEAGNPGSPEWIALEPNSYSDFGSQIATTQRSPITVDRQKRKSVTTDEDAAAGLNIDFTQDNLVSLLPGFFYADWRKPLEFGGGGEVTSVGANVYDAASGLDDFAVGDLVFAAGFGVEGNNGLKRVTAVTATDLTVNSASTEASPPSAATLTKVGVRAGSGDVAVDASGTRPALTSTTLDFTTLGIVAGAWVYVGGDLAANRFAGANNNGIMRVRSIAANRLEFDKTQNTMTTEAGGALEIEIYVSELIRNESTEALIKCKSYQFERSLSTAGYEYVVGCVPNTLSLNVAQADKINADLGFIGLRTDPVDSGSRKSGTFPALDTSATAFNTSSDFSRIRTATDGATEPLFAFITEMTLTINNNVTPAKAIGTLGAFSMNIGDFMIEGNITAYFSDMDAIRAVRNNDSVTVDFFLAKENAGWVFDVPLLTLGEGRLNVEKDAPVTIPVSLSGARDENYNTSLQAAHFKYLPSLAHA